MRFAFIVACSSLLVSCSEEPCDPSGGVICTVAGTGVSGFGGDGGDALEAVFSLPQDVIAGPDGAVFVLDWNNHRIRAITADGRVEHVAGRGELGGDPLDPSGAEGSDFHHPTHMLLSADSGTLVIAAWHNNLIRELDLATGAITDSCGTGDRGYAGDEGPATQALLDLPTSVARSPGGELVVMDQANQVIRVVDAAGVIHRLAGSCVVDRPGGCGDIPLTTCPASDKLTCDLAACDAPCAPGYAGGGIAAADLRMAQPADLPGGRMIFDPAGNLLFADPGNHIIRRIDTAGVVTTVAGTPPAGGEAHPGYAGDGGPATAALLANPVDLALAGDGTLYVSDVDNHCVRAIGTDGIIETVAGTCGVRGRDGDGGPATRALLSFPYGIEVIGGDLYIADMGNNVIRQVGLP